MSFNSFRQHLYRFFSRNDYEESKEVQRMLNNKVLGIFHGFGGKSERQQVEFFFYTDTLDKGNNLAIELTSLHYEVYGVDKCRDDGQYSVIGCTCPLKMDEDSLTGWSEQMCALGYKYDCKFDGWGTLIG